MENQVELIKKLKKITRFNELQVTDIEEWLGYTKNQFYRASRNEIELTDEDINKIKEKIEYFEETGIFKLIDRPRQIIDYDLLHEIDRDYMTNKGSWNPKAYDDPRIPFILYYEDVDK